jgi:hypothetical protein
MAVLQTDATHKALVVWVQNGVHAMHSPRALTTIDDDIDPASLSVADGLVSWKTTAGVVGSVSAR